MKNIRLIAFFFFLMCGGLGFAQKQEISCGLKLTLPFLELRGAVRNKDAFTWPPDYNAGLLLDSESLYKRAPFVFKAGNLVPGGSLSLLNSPLFAQEPSPFGQDTSISVEKLSAALPAKDNFSRPVSYFLEGGYRGTGVFQKAALNLYYDKENAVASSSVRLEPGKKTALVFCFTGGLFPLQKTKDDSWYLQTDFYGQGKHICMNLQSGIMTGSFNCIFTAGLYETPFSSFAAVWRLENQVRTKSFCTVLDFFYNPNQNLITSSGKLIDPLLQVRCGAMVKLSGFTLGTGCLLDINTTLREHSLKTQTGLKYEASFYSGSLTASFDFALGSMEEHITIECPKGNIQSNNSFYIKDFKLELSPKLYFERSSKGVLTLTEKLSFDFEYNGKVKAGLSADVELKHKKNFTDKKLDWTSKIFVEGKIGYVDLSASFVLK